MLLGVVVVLPASLRQRLGVVFGAVLAAGGVFLFWEVYPQRWTRTADPLAFETMMLYGLGCAIALWFVFSTIASFRLRNNPQGMVELEVVKEGSTRTIEVSQDKYRQIVSDGGNADAVIEELDD
jgi:ABC-type thiamin/hydroxymethylpyrimidine transport system permease subunit